MCDVEHCKDVGYHLYMEPAWVQGASFWPEGTGQDGITVQVM